MAAAVTVKDDSTKLQKLLSRLLNKGALSVGILAGEAAKTHEAKTIEGRIADVFKGFDSGHEGATGKGKSEALTIGELASIHEFGLGSCPQRSFLQGWADENTAQINNVVNKGAQALVQGKLDSPLQLMNQIGSWAVGQIQQRMATSIPPPLAPETIRRKGSSVSLIDTGQLRSSVSFRVDTVLVLASGASYGPGPETPGDIGIDFAAGDTATTKRRGNKTWITGPRGGQYYVSANGKKVYRSWELVK